MSLFLKVSEVVSEREIKIPGQRGVNPASYLYKKERKHFYTLIGLLFLFNKQKIFTLRFFFK